MTSLSIDKCVMKKVVEVYPVPMEPLNLLAYQQKRFLGKITAGPIPQSLAVSQGSSVVKKLKLELHKVQWGITDDLTSPKQD